VKIAFPMAQKTTTIRKLARSARTAIVRRVAASWSAVSPRKTGVFAIGFMMAKKPMNTDSA
jgi:hypothetical protein